jgi:hypothetical protein
MTMSDRETVFPMAVVGSFSNHRATTRPPNQSDHATSRGFRRRSSADGDTDVSLASSRRVRAWRIAPQTVRWSVAEMNVLGTSAGSCRTQ